MAVITDPDSITDSATDDGSANMFINTATQRIKLVAGQGGLVAADGVIEKAVYSKLKEDWKNDPNAKNLTAFDFPMVPITDEFYELVDGWDWEDATTEKYIRRGGWLVRNLAGLRIKQFAAIAILNAEPDDQIYFDLGAGATDFTYPGNTAEAVQVIDDPNGDGLYADGFDRSANIECYNREQGQIFAKNSTVAVGESSLLAPKLFSLDLATGTDRDIEASDITIDGNAPFTGMSITFFAAPQSRSIGGSSRDFGVIIDGNSGTRQEIYEFEQWAIRQLSDQDAGGGTLNGKVMPQLLQFVGDSLKTQFITNYAGGGGGVYIDNYSPADVNFIQFQDNLQTERAEPFVAGIALAFNSVMQIDADTEYWLYYLDGVDAGDEYGTATSILVENNAGSPITGLVSGSGTILTDYDYDNNNQGNRTPGTDANVVLKAIGLGGAQSVKALGVITRSSANSLSFVASVERNYAND
jgi:hypothetical protein